MNFRFSLRYRVAFAFLMLGWLISMAMGGALYWLTVSMEEELIEETLSIELEDYIRSYTLDPKAEPPSSTHMQGYVVTENTRHTLPTELQQLPEGLSHIALDGSGYYVEIKQHNGARFLILYADEIVKAKEKQYFGFLALGIGLMTLISSVIGLWLAGRVISPVTRLAEQVSAMGTDFTPLITEEDLPNDEVGELSRAIDSYHKRLAQFNERERAFTSNVSHELRTPLAVIEGAAEVMLSENDLSTASQQRVERIARAASQITRMTSALLALAREESDSDSQHECHVDRILIQVVDEHEYLLKHKPVNVELKTDSDFTLTSNAILLYVVLANLIRNAFSYTRQGVIRIRQSGDRVLIEDTGVGMNDDQLQHIFDRHYQANPSRQGYGIGLSLASRICEHYGWEISVQSQEGQGTSIALVLK